MRQIELFSFSGMYSSGELLPILDRVSKSHSYILGKEVAAFEKEFAQYIGVSECITVANGTDALELSLKGVNIKPGDHIATVANAGFYSSTAIHAVGAIPLYVDISNESLTMSIISLKTAFFSTKKPKAVIVTHLYGQIAPNILEIKKICEEAQVPLIEDCAQATGASINGKKAGSFGDLATFSFYPTKNLGALGDGGAIVTNNNILATRIKRLRQYGWSEKYQVVLPGGQNSRMDEIQAAILREKLPYLDEWNKMRRSIAAAYNNAFKDLPIQYPISIREDYVAHLYVIRVREQDRLRHFLKEKKIVTDVHYPIPDHLQPAYPLCTDNSLAVTELACQSVVSLPCYPGLNDGERERVIAAVQDFFTT